MSEQSLVSQIPTEEELQAEYRGLCFDQFKTLSDEQVDVLHEERRVEAIARLDKEIAALEAGAEQCRSSADYDQAFFAGVHETNVFLNFVNWRRFGIPDRNMTREELMQRTGDVIRARREVEPEFGVLLPREYRKLSPHQKLAIQSVNRYLIRMRDPFEPMTLDDYSLQETIGLYPRDVATLLRHKVLQPLGSAGLAGNAYLLAEPYTNHLLVQAFAKSEVGST